MPKVIVKLPKMWRNPLAQGDQARFVWSPKRISLAATGIKTGKTLGCSVWRIDYGIKVPGLHWWVAPFRKQAKIGYNRVKDLLPPNYFETNESDLAIVLKKKPTTIFEFKTGENPDSLFGEGIMSLVVDEGGRLKEQSWVACNSTMLQTQGPIRIASNTDKGRRNWLYREFLRGQSGHPEIDSWHIRSTEAPHFMAGGRPGPKAIDDFRSKFSPLVFRALVEAEFPEDAATVFPGLSRVTIDSWNGEKLDDKRLPWIYAYPPWEGGVYVGGVDLANRRDWTVITVVDANSGLVVYWTRFQNTMWSEQLRRIKEVQKAYGCPFLVDSTPGSVGDPILERLQMSDVRCEGYEFTNRSKQWLVERLAVDIQEQQIFIPACLRVLVTELEELERNISDSGVVTYSAPDSVSEDGEESHDDSVFSLALANWLRGYAYEVGKTSGELRNPSRGGLARQGYLAEGGRR